MKFRAGRIADIEPSVAMLREHGGWRAPAHVWAALPDIVAAGIADGTLLFQVFEDDEVAAGPALAAFRISAFIDESFAIGFAFEPHPYVSARIWQLLLDGSMPLLDRAAVAEHNALGTLRLGVLHWCVRDSNPLAGQTLRVLAQVPNAWQFAHGGYHVESIAFYEVYGKAHATVMRNIGYRCYEGFPALPHDARERLDDDLAPYCFHAERHDMQLGTAAMVGVSMFHAAQPRFGLSPAQQRMAVLALEGAADRQLAAELGIGYDSVRKAWEAMYARVSDVDPAVLPDAASGRGHRGTEKRRVLLEYLRRHLEELRPFKRRAGANRIADEANVTKALRRRQA